MSRRYKSSSARASVCAILLLLGASNIATAGYSPRDGRFYERSEEGWFFYEPELKPQVETETPSKQPEVAPEPVETLKLPEQQPEVAAAVAPPAALSIKWFRENVNKYRDRAIDNPTPENVSAFLYVQKMAIDKSHKFANTWEKVVLSTPDLDANSRRPLSSGAGFAVDAEAKTNQEKILASLTDKVGIWFFYSSESPYALRQGKILAAVEKGMGFKVLPISMDNAPLPGDVFPSYVSDSGQASVIGVRQVPSTYMVTKDGVIKPLGEGVIAYRDLQDRLMVVAQINGLISDEQYASAQPLLNGDMELADRLSSLLEAEPTDESGFIEPNALLEHIDRASKQ
ncbi:conjugal transfer protein TraF [Hydrocarboniclastica marina]|uniref:Conjugal transfer protein TraF n=1 Tax=Hydrocarboniclastica marina TaxID=2259620 RepID=A0A4P7XLF4_9ALTE|nr:conjugal transfer protein TraF [Hydrocarboniclastica marina]QCF28079.1 hypothetical protein soil367_18575 [Hydrocarboniclastica marina]